MLSVFMLVLAIDFYTGKGLVPGGGGGKVVQVVIVLEGNCPTGRGGEERYCEKMKKKGKK